MEIIKIQNLTKTYHKDNKVIKVLNGITLTFETGKFYVIKGKSGAGKSTFLNCLGLLTDYDEGELIINNTKIRTSNDKELSKMRKENIGFVFQSYYLIPNMTALENVMVPLYLNKNMTADNRKSFATELLKKMELEDRANHFPKELSGGEQQRVAIARALINNPDIILGDEPTGNLDNETEEVIYKILKKLSESGKCVIVVSHNDSILKYADVIYEIKDGEVRKNND